jgi:hypothetical protein
MQIVAQLYKGPQSTSWSPILRDFSSLRLLLHPIPEHFAHRIGDSPMRESRLSGGCLLSYIQEPSLDITRRLRISFLASLNSVTVPLVVLPVLECNPDERQAQDADSISFMHSPFTTYARTTASPMTTPLSVQLRPVQVLTIPMTVRAIAAIQNPTSRTSRMRNAFRLAYRCRALMFSVIS